MSSLALESSIPSGALPGKGTHISAPTSSSTTPESLVVDDSVVCMEESSRSRVNSDAYNTTQQFSSISMSAHNAFYSTPSSSSPSSVSNNLNPPAASGDSTSSYAYRQNRKRRNSRFHAAQPALSPAQHSLGDNQLLQMQEQFEHTDLNASSGTGSVHSTYRSVEPTNKRLHQEGPSQSYHPPHPSYQMHQPVPAQPHYSSDPLHQSLHHPYSTISPRSAYSNGTHHSENMVVDGMISGVIHESPSSSQAMSPYDAQAPQDMNFNFQIAVPTMSSMSYAQPSSSHQNPPYRNGQWTVDPSSSHSHSAAAASAAVAAAASVANAAAPYPNGKQQITYHTASAVSQQQQQQRPAAVQNPSSSSLGAIQQQQQQPHAPSSNSHQAMQQPPPSASSQHSVGSTGPTTSYSAHNLPLSPSRPALLSVLSCVLTQLFSNPNDTLPTDPAKISMFHTERIPAISIGQYLERLAYYAECSEEALVSSFIHISRIYHSNNSNSNAVPGAKGFQLNTLSIHRLLLVAIMCSAKFFDDSYYNNAYYARIGGVAIRELNALEVEFLALIQFDLYIPASIYKRFYKELCNGALHPHCTCSYKLLPNMDFDESLPLSPLHDVPLEVLEAGQAMMVREGHVGSYHELIYANQLQAQQYQLQPSQIDVPHHSVVVHHPQQPQQQLMMQQQQVLRQQVQVNQPYPQQQYHPSNIITPSAKPDYHSDMGEVKHM